MQFGISLYLSSSLCAHIIIIIQFLEKHTFIDSSCSIQSKKASEIPYQMMLRDFGRHENVLLKI